MTIVHIISRRALSDFWAIHPEARALLTSWFRVLERNEFRDFHSIRSAFRSADYVAPFTVFDVGGNRYRVVTVVHYNRGRVYIRRVLTHSEYDRWSAFRHREP
jgi:mRNA interferase HigB